MSAPRPVHACPGYDGEPVWLLGPGPDGTWIAECEHPACAWHTDPQATAEAADDHALSHAITDHPQTSPAPLWRAA
jgi:hypothetical protein